MKLNIHKTQIIQPEKNELMLFTAIWIQLENIINEVNQKDKYHMISLICIIFKKKLIQMNLFTKQKQTHRLRKQIYGY